MVANTTSIGAANTTSIGAAKTTRIRAANTTGTRAAMEMPGASRKATLTTGALVVKVDSTRGNMVATKAVGSANKVGNLREARKGIPIMAGALRTTLVTLIQVQCLGETPFLPYAPRIVDYAASQAAFLPLLPSIKHPLALWAAD